MFKWWLSVRQKTVKIRRPSCHRNKIRAASLDSSTVENARPSSWMSPQVFCLYITWLRSAINKYTDCPTAGMFWVYCCISTKNAFKLQSRNSLLIYSDPIVWYLQSNVHICAVSLKLVQLLRVLYLSLFSPYCPPVCMPAAGCQPIRPPGQFLQPLALLQRHQHWQRSTRGHQLLPLHWDVCPEGGQHPDTLPVCGYFSGHRAGSSPYNATCRGATAIAASYHFTHGLVSFALFKSWCVEADLKCQFH